LRIITKITECMKKLLIFNVILCVLTTHLGFAQQPISLRGKVLDEVGVPITGVSVSLGGTATVTATNGSGDFTVPYTPPATLHFTAVGYIAQEVELTG